MCPVSPFFYPSSGIQEKNETKQNNKTSMVPANNGGWGPLAFNASFSNSIYGNSSTVQPPAITLIPLIKY